MNEDAYEEYLREQVRLKEAIEDMESQISWLEEDLTDRKNDLKELEDELDCISIEDYLD